MYSLTPQAVDVIQRWMGLRDDEGGIDPWRQEASTQEGGGSGELEGKERTLHDTGKLWHV